MKGNPGRLQVKLERCVVDVAHAAAQPPLQPGVYALITVSDTGCGMNQATLQHIFEPFFTTRPHGEGTGLGLAVVHGIMESHDGAVTVHSQPGEGTVFHLYFPAHASATAGAEVGDQTPRGHGERILVVDDEAPLAGLCEKTLASLGYEAEFTTQPADALAMVEADPQRFALVLTDQVMPGMCGLTLANQLLRACPGLPIILMTGFTASLTDEDVKAAGIRQLLLSPFPAARWEPRYTWRFSRRQTPRHGRHSHHRRRQLPKRGPSPCAEPSRSLRDRGAKRQGRPEAIRFDWRRPADHGHDHARDGRMRGIDGAPPQESVAEDHRDLGWSPAGRGDVLHIATLLGASKVLRKPFSYEVLVATVNGLLADAGNSVAARATAADG